MSAEHALLHAAVALFAYRRRLSMTFSTEEAAETWWQLSAHLDQWLNQYHLAGPPAADAPDDGMTDLGGGSDGLRPPHRAVPAAATTSPTVASSAPADATARTLLLLRTIHVLLHQCALLCKCVQRHSAGITAILARWAILLQPYEAGPPAASPTAIMTCSVDNSSADSLGVTLSATSSGYSHQFHSEAVSDLEDGHDHDDDDDDHDDGDSDSESDSGSGSDDDGDDGSDGAHAGSDDDDDDGDAASSDTGMARTSSQIPYPVAPTYQPAWQTPAPHATVRTSHSASSSASSTGSAVVVASRGSSTTSPPEMTPSPPQRPRSHHAPRPANVPPAEPGRRPPFSPHVRTKLYGWLHAHAHDPYPSIREKEHLVAATGITMSQLNNWLINARRRALPVRPYPTGKASAARPSGSNSRSDRRRRR